MINGTINTTVTPYPVTITEVPFYDGIIEGFFFIPQWIATWFTEAIGIYNFGFWLGIIFFLWIICAIFSWGDQG